ncbi:MAG: primosomal protein N' [Gammaproteobacteria bacterium]|nr:primosomal protein N' [Gammaproteobacteria bacterium]
MTVTPVIKVAVPRPIYSTYEYSIHPAQETPCIGGRVAVPFGKSREEIGICIQTRIMSRRTDLKSISKILDTEPVISPNMMNFAHWISQYYVYPVGEVLFSMLPSFLRKGKPLRLSESNRWELKDLSFENKRAQSQTNLFLYLKENPSASTETLVQEGFSRATIKTLERKGIICQAATKTDYLSQIVQPKPTQEQKLAIDNICSYLGTHQTFLLEGITGSGKTEVYLQTIERAISRNNGQALVLVPEINLTPQNLQRFRDRFGDCGILHSSLPPKQKLDEWIKCKHGVSRVVLGTRSSILAPFANLSLIIVDEEHDTSYKQSEGLKYSARDLAVKRSKDLGIPLVLGSATPSLESIQNQKLGRYILLSIKSRFGPANLPKIEVLDMREENQIDGLSHSLIKAIRGCIEKRQQALLYINRRGFSPSVICKNCGYQFQCANCDAKLILHHSPKQLACHSCERTYSAPTECIRCNSNKLIPLGAGTQRIELAIERMFSDTGVLRIDRDSSKSLKSLSTLLGAIEEDKPLVLIGTQMLAKGHHFPSVTLVGIINADAGMLSPDFKAPERTAQTLVQVSGRAGRGKTPGKVLIQTYQPNNPNLRLLVEKGYSNFAEQELATRSQSKLPPFRRLAIIRSESSDHKAAHRFLEHYRDKILSTSSNKKKSLEIFGPLKAPLGKIENRYRFQLIVLADSAQELRDSLWQWVPSTSQRNIKWTIDIDPNDAV